MLGPSPRRSFYGVISRARGDQNTWCWDIRRKRTPMDVRLWECGFPSHRAAHVAGKQALEDLLNGLSSETVSKSHF
jgi:hypothetical protein